jgi:hypothetical protein
MDTAIGDSEHQWTLLTNHGRILLIIARDQELRIRDVALAAGVTERRVCIEFIVPKYYVHAVGEVNPPASEHACISH